MIEHRFRTSMERDDCGYDYCTGHTRMVLLCSCGYKTPIPSGALDDNILRDYDRHLIDEMAKSLGFAIGLDEAAALSDAVSLEEGE